MQIDSQPTNNIINQTLTGASGSRRVKALSEGYKFCSELNHLPVNQPEIGLTSNTPEDRSLHKQYEQLKWNKSAPRTVLCTSCETCDVGQICGSKQNVIESRQHSNYQTRSKIEGKSGLKFLRALFKTPKKTLAKLIPRTTWHGGSSGTRSHMNVPLPPQVRHSTWAIIVMVQ